MLIEFYQGRPLEPEVASLFNPHAKLKSVGALIRDLNTEDTMGWFVSLFGSTPDPANERKSRAPTDPDQKGHISRKAVHAEYNRLVLEKCSQDKV
jgi:hypothetical protein